MSARAVARFLKARGLEVKATRGESQLLRVTMPEGEEVCEVVQSSAQWEAAWQCGYSLTLGQFVEPLPARYIVVSKGGAAMCVFEVGARKFWSVNRNGTFDAPLVTGDFFRIDGKAPAPFTRDMLMKQPGVRPRKISPKEAAFLDSRKSLGKFRVLADMLRTQ
jgi:hypothetical protein